MVKAVGYLRVSQEDEDVENQRQAILRFAKERGFEVVAWFRDEAVSGTVPPRSREGYNSMLKFCRDNEVKVIIFYDLSRLARSVEEGLRELKQLADEGFDFYFAGMDFLNYDNIDPMLKKKLIMDFLWFAELYVEDIKRRTKVALERREAEGKLIHRPRLIHYIALYLSGKREFRELAPQDLERAKAFIRERLGKDLKKGLPLTRLKTLFEKELSGLYEELKAPRSLKAFRKMISEVFGS